MLSADKKVDYKTKNETTLANKSQTKFRATQTKKSKFKGKYQIPSEVERWATGTQDEVVKYDSDDEIENIDDTYLNFIAEIDTRIETEEREDESKNEEEQREKIRNILLNVRRNKELKKKLSKSFHRSKTIAEITLDSIPIKNENKKSADVKIIDDKDGDDLQKNRKKQRNADTSFKFKSVNNGLTRAVPGSLQQNITVERTFFKDLLKLSKQRYLFKLGSDFQKRQFTTKQERKGLIVKQTDDAFITSTDNLSMTNSKKNKALNNNTNSVYANRKLKCASAFGVRPTTEPVYFTENTIDSIQLEKKPVKKISSTINLKDVSLEDFHNTLKPIMKANSLFDMNLSEQDERLSKKSKSSSFKSSLKRPNTSLATFTNTFESYNENYDWKNLQDDPNKPKIMSKASLRANPTADNRYKELVDCMNNVYIPAKSSELNKKPDDRVRNLIRSNKALQGVGWNGDNEHEKPSRFEIEMNKKLFEKLISNLF